MDKYRLQQAARAFSAPLYHTGIHILAAPWHSGAGTILMFHRVLPPTPGPRVYNHLGLEIAPERLEAVIRFFRERDYEFLSLDEIAARRETDRGKRKFVAFTFDDGYADNHAYAYPILKRHGVPFAVYVATGMPDGHAFPWWYLLEEIILGRDWIEAELQEGTTRLPARTPAEKEIAFGRINGALSRADAAGLERFKRTLFAGRLSRGEELARELALSWDRIAEMARDPLVTIGAHSVNHFPLTALGDGESRFEMRESKRILEERLQKEVRHFCYPIGAYSAREIRYAGECGYRSATAVNMANFQPGHAALPYQWPRIMINALTTPKLLALQVSGLLPCIYNRGRRLVK